MQKINTDFLGLYIIESQIFEDKRGWFYETYSKRDFIEAGIDFEFIQDNHALSLRKNVIRGLHFQNDPEAQTKLIRCVKGSVLDVVVDLRIGSPTYKKWMSVELSAENKKQLLVPAGFAHGYLTLEQNVEVQYKVDMYYNKQLDRSIKYNDPDIGIDWGIVKPILSEKDLNAPFLAESDCNFHY